MLRHVSPQPQLTPLGLSIGWMGADHKLLDRLLPCPGCGRGLTENCRLDCPGYEIDDEERP